MPQVTVRCHPVANTLLEFLRLGETAELTARPDQFAIEPHLEHAPGAGAQRHLREFLLEGGQQLLGKPGRAQQPSALGAVADLDAISGGRAHRRHDTASGRSLARTAALPVAVVLIAATLLAPAATTAEAQARLDARVTLGSGSPPLDEGPVSWRLQPLDDTREATPRHAFSAHWSTTVPTGNYRLEARLGHASAATELTLGDDERTVVLDLGAGVLQAGLDWPSTLRADAPHAVWTALGPDDRAPLAYAIGAQARWVLPAGTYAVTAEVDGARTEAAVHVEPGRHDAITLALRAGEVRASAAAVAGGPTLDQDLEWWVTEAGEDGALVSWRHEASPQFILAPGTYRIEVHAGAARATVEMLVDADTRESVELILQVGRLVLDPGEDVEDAYWQVQSGPPGPEISVLSYRRRPELLLPQGEYRVVLETAAGSYTETVSVPAGAVVELRLGP